MIYKNNTPPLTLAATIGTTDTSVVVTEDVSWIQPPMTFVIDAGRASEEAVYVTAVNTATKTLTVIRGADGYTAQSHAAGAEMRHMVLAHALAWMQIFGIAWNHTHQYVTPLVLTPPSTSNWQPTDQRIYYTPIPIMRPVVVASMGLNFTGAGSDDGTTYFGIYDSRKNGESLPHNLIWGSAGINISATGQTLVSPNLYLEPGLYWFAFLNTGYTTYPQLKAWTDNKVMLFRWQFYQGDWGRGGAQSEVGQTSLLATTNGVWHGPGQNIAYWYIGFQNP